MLHHFQTATLLAVWLGLSAIIGCGGNPGPKITQVTGEVKIDGQPLSEGFLYFKTIETGALERMDIKNGEFTGKAQVGTRRVEVYANKIITVVIDGNNVDVPENYIHPSFNSETTLIAEVTEAGPNHFQFAVKRK